MEVSNPYKFTIDKNKNHFVVTVKPIDISATMWPTYTDVYGSTMMAANYDLEIPGGINVIYLHIDYQNSAPIAAFKLINTESKKVWFNTINSSGFVTENIGVTPNTTYHLSITDPVQIVGADSSKGFHMDYSNQINSYKVTIEDYK